MNDSTILDFDSILFNFLDIFSSFSSEINLELHEIEKTFQI